MKPLFLEFCGINSFSERAQIDFTKLTRYGIFGIFGDTGSGKSTILDCIHFAVYGALSYIPKNGSLADIVNYKLDKAFVNFEFEIVYEGKRRTFRVERELKRKNASHSAKAYERKGETLLALAEGVRDVNNTLKAIVGLEQNEFEKCIALPQGEFAQFVKSGKGDRLKLIANLFGLQDYGERLYVKNKTHLERWGNERTALSARLEGYAEVTAESNAMLKADIQSDTQKEKALKGQLDALREEEKRISALAQKRENYEKFLKEYADLVGQYAEYDRLKGDLARLERAEGYLIAIGKREKAQADFQRAQQKRERAETGKAQAEKEERARADQLAELRKNDRTVELTARLVQAQNLAQVRAQLEKKRLELEDTRRKYRAEKEKYPDFSYGEEKSRLEREKATLGEGDLIAFAVERGKESLFREEYAQFVEELTALTERHPAIEGDTAPLIARYTALSLGDRASFEQLKADFEAREKRRKELDQLLLALEKENGLYQSHLERLEHLKSQGQSLKEEVEELSKNIPENAPSEESAKRDLDGYQAECKRAQTAYEDAANKVKNLTELCAQALSEYASSERELALQTESANAFEEFSSKDEAQALIDRYGNAAMARERTEKYFTDYQTAVSRKQEYEQEDVSEGAEENVRAVREKLSRAEGEYQTLSSMLAVKTNELSRREGMLVEKAELEEKLKGATEQYNIYERIKKLVTGNKFVEFLAEEYLQNIAGSASGRLLSLTDGRYFLKYEGENFVVGDNYNGGLARGTHTLSGGETFLVSLSLALALSGEICAKSLRPIEFFFLDEGFGTLDEKLVDTVMDSLEKLKNEHFSIGIISHVEELKHRIESKLLIEKASEVHGSQIHAT